MKHLIDNTGPDSQIWTEVTRETYDKHLEYSLSNTNGLLEHMKLIDNYIHWTHTRDAWNWVINGCNNDTKYKNTHWYIKKEYYDKTREV